MAPGANYITEELKPAVLYNEYKQNEHSAELIQPLKNNEAFSNVDTKQKDTAPVEKGESSMQKEPGYQVGDRVVVNSIEVKKMKHLQKDHGGWDPRMEQAIGKHGTIIGILPDGDLHVRMATLVEWILNPECVTFVDRYAINFKKNEKARFKKNISLPEMKRMQETRGEWLPIMGSLLPGCICTVMSTKMIDFGLLVKLSNGYMFYVNSNLLEKVDQSLQAESKRCYQRGDIVKLKDMDVEEFERHYKEYGLDFDKKILAEKNSEGKIVNVNFGRIIHVLMENKTILVCCPPIVKLIKETDVDEETGDQESELMKQVVIHQLITKLKIEEFGDLTMPPDAPEDFKNMFMGAMREMNDLIQKEILDMFEKQATQQYKPDERNENFQPGDRVRIKDINLFEFMIDQKMHGGFHPAMVFVSGKTGFVEKVSDNSDLRIELDDGTPSQWIFNPKCVELISKAEKHNFKEGQRVRFRSISTDQMTKLQEHHGGWVPLMEQMKSKECTIKACLPYRLHVEMHDGYEWMVNPKLLEAVGPEQHKERRQRGYKVGDKVRIKDMTKEDMKKLNTHHGIHWNNLIYHSRGKEGQVFEVTFGRVIHIQLTNRESIMCCRPCLDMVKESTVDEQETQPEQSLPMELGSGEMVRIRQSYAGHLQVEVHAIYTPRDLLVASANGYVQATKTILQRHPKWVNVISEDGQHTALMNACTSGSVDTVKAMVEAGAELDMENFEGNTATIITAWMGKIDILKYLLDNGSKVNLPNVEGQNALHAAIWGGSEECVKLILKHCSTNDLTLQTTDGMNSVTLALRLKSESVCKVIFQSSKFDASYRDEQGFSALHQAVVAGNEFAVKTLLGIYPKGINQQKMDKWTALHLAAFNNYSGILKVLLNHEECDRNIVNEDEETALFLSIKRCNKEVAELLLEAGADPNIPNEDSETCLHYVFKLREKAVYETWDAISHTNLSSLLGAVEAIKASVLPGKKQWLELGRFLVSMGAKVDIKDKSSKTPLEHIKNDVIKAEILTEVEARHTIKNNLKDFQDQLKGMTDSERLTKVYQNQSFTARYFDDKGGYMEIEKANVRMYIPPGAVKQPQQLIYIHLDPVSHDVKGKLSPVVEVGPPGTKFNKKVTLSYPHCAANESEWKFSTLICEGTTSTDSNWKDVHKDKDVESFVKNGRAIIKTPHFTKFTTTGEPKQAEVPVQKNMRIGAFGKDHEHGKESYQFRVRTWDDTVDATQKIRKKETEYLNTKPLDDDRPLLVRNTNQDVSVKVSDFNKGWKPRTQDCGDQYLKFNDVWDNNYPSCTIDLHRSDDTSSDTASQDVHCRVKAKQMKAPDKDLVHLSISPETTLPSEEQLRNPAPMPTMKEQVYGPFPNDLPGMPKDMFIHLCGLLNVEDDLNGDWRLIMEEMGEDDVTTITNISKLCQKNDSPANFALRNYLYECRTVGSNDPVQDLRELFERKQLHEALQYIKQYQSNSNHIC